MRNTGVISDEKPASVHHRSQLEKRQSLGKNGSVGSRCLEGLPDFWAFGWAKNDEDF
jgi:hypothetical protein